MGTWEFIILSTLWKFAKFPSKEKQNPRVHRVLADHVSVRRGPGGDRELTCLMHPDDFCQGT